MLLAAVLGRALAAIAQTFSTIDTTAAGVTGDTKYRGAAAVGTSVVFGPYNEDNVGVLVLPTTSSAGDDPTFVGADGLPYEVRGEPWKYFNLLSTPRLSLNAQFLPVPERFVHGKITDTVLGTLHLALCDAPRSRIVGATFDVFSGAIGCTVRSPDDELGSTEPAPCAEVLPLAHQYRADALVEVCATRLEAFARNRAAELVVTRKDASAERPA